MSPVSEHAVDALPQRRLVAIAVSVALGTAAGAAMAQSEETGQKQLPKISVEAADDPYKVDESSSPKYTVPLRDVAQTITVIPRTLIEEQGATTLRDTLRNTPGITFQAGEGGGGLPGDQNFTMRGFSARNSLYIDGVRDSGAYTRDAFNLEQVEVAKGPTGSLAGRSATAGAINQVSKTPYLEPFQDYTLGLGMDQYRRATVDVNQPVGGSRALRLNAMFHDADGVDRDVVENQRWGIAPSFAFGLGTGTRLTLSYLYLEEDNVPDYGLPWGNVTQDGVTYETGAFRANPPVDQSNFYGLRDYDFEDIESQVATAQLDHDFSETLGLSNVLRFLDTERDSAITAPRPPRRQLQRRTIGVENLTNQTNLRLSLDGGRFAHEVSTGLELSREKTDNRNSAQSTNQPEIVDFFNPDPSLAPLGPMPANSGNPSEATVETVGLYAFDTVRLSERWSVNGGLRWDQVDVEYETLDLANGTLARVTSDDSMVSWQAGVVFKPAAHGSVYFGYGTSFDPAVDAGNTGAGFGLEADDVNNPNLDPEETRNYELGTKWDLAGGRLLVTGAIFRTEKTNARTRTANNEPFILEGEQRVDGIELSATGSIGEHWSVFGGYAYLDSEIEKSANPVEESTALLLTPEHSFNLWTTYRMGDLMVGGGAQFIDSVIRRRDAATGAELAVPSYMLFDLMASYRFSDALTFRLNGTNLGDKQYVDRVGGGHYIPGPGRSAWLTADFNF